MQVAYRILTSLDTTFAWRPRHVNQSRWKIYKGAECEGSEYYLQSYSFSIHLSMYSGSICSLCLTWEIVGILSDTIGIAKCHPQTRHGFGKGVLTYQEQVDHQSSSNRLPTSIAAVTLMIDEIRISIGWSDRFANSTLRTISLNVALSFLCFWGLFHWHQQS